MKKTFSITPVIINSGNRPYVKGKFIFCGDEKIYIKGVTYGTFAPDVNGRQFPSQEQIETDFRMMNEQGFNCVRTYTVPPIHLLDIAHKYGLRVMAGLPWEQHIAFLEDRKTGDDIRRRVDESVRSCNAHPAILCYTIGNEIPAPVVRWYGSRKIEKFLYSLYRTAKKADPGGLVTYVNYPTTEYLNLPFVDFYSFNVYLESEEKLRAYILRLHNLCDNLPLVLAEIGLDSMRNGEQKQAEILRWQISTIFSGGCAGMFVFAWTDQWWRGGSDILDWDFGLVTRDRISKPALKVVHDAMQDVPFLPGKKEKFISVVVCSYNGSATIAECLEGLINLNYSNYEVIVINDGSTDNFASIVEKYPVKLISTPNRGLSSARNLGMSYAKGEIVAYIDDDAYPDSEWLNYLNMAFQQTSHAAVGGPNLVPDNDGSIAKCIACSPGGPVHVLLTDEIAEHIPGCNMAFRRDVLLRIGGFDPVYRAAGDDVDICWRIQDLGYTIGYHHAAIVWHHRRNSLKTYWKQQKGYGKAEALLEKKWPEKYNALGHYNWAGSIYGNGNTRPLELKTKQIFYGRWGSALFQSVYQPSGSHWYSIPLMPEWYLLCIFLAAAGFFGFWFPPLQIAWIACALCTLVVVMQAYLSACRNLKKIASLNGKDRYRLLVTLMHIAQPAARLYGRFTNGLTPWRRRGVRLTKRIEGKPGGSVFLFWSEVWKSNEDWLMQLENNLKKLKATVKRGGDFDAWDLSIRIDMFSKIKSSLLVEEHGGGKQYLRLNCKLNYSILAIAPLIFLAIGTITAAFIGQYAAFAITFLFLLALLMRVHHGAVSSKHTIYTALQHLQDEPEIKKIQITYPGNKVKEFTRHDAVRILQEEIN